jgi:acetoin:2,6-dichlorophenolindophenol oxidoreductase subunit beta
MKTASAPTNLPFKRLSYMDAINEAQIEEMNRDERVILIGENLALYGDAKVLQAFGTRRVWDAPISENSFTGMAVGAAMTGMRPVVNLTIASFMYLACDQIINQAGKLHYMTGGQMKVPAVFRCCMYYNSSIAAQHSDRCYPMFMNSPGLKIIAPTSPADMKGLLKSAIRDDDPVVVFEDSTLWTIKEEVPSDPDCLVPIGRADIKHAGSDVTIVAVAGSMKAALSAAKALKADGISVEVVDPRTLVPLDKDTIIQSVAKTGRLIVVDNANRTCNAAAEIAAMVAEEAFDYLRKPIRRLSTPDVHIPFSPALEKQLYPSQEAIIAAVRSLQ